MCNISSKARQAGLSLVEMMVAMLVGLVLMAGVLSIFISTHTGSVVNTAIAQLQENGRFSLDFMRTDARVTGYMGCATTARTVNILNILGQLYSFSASTPVYGYEFTGGAGTGPGDTYPLGENPNETSAGWSPAFDSTITINAIPGSDMLVLYSTTGNPVYTISPTNAGAVTLTDGSGSNFGGGQLAVISDCLKSTVFQVSSVVGDVINITTTGFPGNTIGTFDPSYDVGAQVLPASVTVYFIGQGTTNKEPGLYRMQLGATGTLGAAQEMVPGVENMQILYGVVADGNGLGTPSQFLTAAQTADAGLWSNVVSMQVGLLLRSNTGVVPLPAAGQTFNLLGTNIVAPVDTRLRRVFTTTIYFRNLLPGV